MHRLPTLSRNPASWILPGCVETDFKRHQEAEVPSRVSLTLYFSCGTVLAFLSPVLTCCLKVGAFNCPSGHGPLTSYTTSSHTRWEQEACVTHSQASAGTARGPSQVEGETPRLADEIFPTLLQKHTYSSKTGVSKLAVHSQTVFAPLEAGRSLLELLRSAAVALQQP